MNTCKRAYSQQPHKSTFKPGAPTLDVLLCESVPRKARILFASQDVAGPILNGGIGTAVRNLASKLAAYGHNVSILYSLGEYVSPNNPRTWTQWQSFYRDSYGVTLHSISRDFSYETPDSSISVRRSYEVYLWLQDHENDFDFVHFPEWQGTGFFSLLAKKQGLYFADTVFAVETHSPSLWALAGNKELPDELGFFDRTFMERKSVEFADFVISPSQYMIDWMVTNGWVLPSNTFVQPNTMVSTILAGKTNARNCFAKWDIVFFGRLEERKGIFVFIDAVQGLMKEETMQYLRIHLLGKIVSSFFPEIKMRIAQLRETVNITLHTSLNVEESLAFLQATPCRLAVMPSLFDNLPSTVLECLISKVHFITSDSGGGKELIDPSMLGLLTFPPTVVDLERKLSYIMRNGVPLGKMATPLHVIDAVWSAWHDQTFASALPVMPWRPSWIMQPFVSVIITTFNQSCFILLQAIHSLLQQEYSNFEVILVNDGGTKFLTRTDLAEMRVLFLLRKWQIVDIQENSYLGAARNEGVRHSKGQLLMFMDDDNVAKPYELRVFTSVYQRNNVDVLTCHFDIFNTLSPPATATARWIPTGNTETSWAVNSLGDANFVISRGIFDALGGFTEDRLAFEDWEFLVNAHLSGRSVQVVPEPLFWKRKTKNSMLSSQNFHASSVRAFRPYARQSASALLVAKAFFDRTIPVEMLVSTDSDFELYQGYKGLYYVYRVKGTCTWRELFIGVRALHKKPVFVGEDEMTYFGVLSITQFHMHPMRHADVDFEVAKLWKSNMRGSVQITGSVTLEQSGCGGVIMRITTFDEVVVEQMLHDKYPRFDFSESIQVNVEDELAFVIAASGNSSDFCSTWSRFTVTRQNHGFDTAAPLRVKRKCETTSTAVGLPNIFIVGAPECDTDLLAHSIVTSCDSIVVLDASKTNFFFTGNNTFLNLKRFSGVDISNMTYENNPSYFMSSSVAARIARIVPNAKIMIAVCEPSERLWSLFHRLRKLKNDTLISDVSQLTFPAFVSHIRARPKMAHVFEAGFYFKHIQLWSGIFGQNVFVWDRDRFSVDSVSVTTSVLHFLHARPGTNGILPRPVISTVSSLPVISTEERDNIMALYLQSWTRLQQQLAQIS